MELKQGLHSSSDRVYESLNRTFMELKRVYGADEREEGGSLNRTFMELKLEYIRKKMGVSYVLIVPLWN